MTPQELRYSIIRLAMQGQLVEQRTEDGTAETLKVAIGNDRKQKIRNKTTKENKKVEPITEDVLPFDIPESWEWIRFGELVSYNMGKTPPRAEAQWWGNDIPWVSIADMPENGHIIQTKESVSKDSISEKFSDKISKAGTLLMSFKLTVGRVSILDIDAVHNEAIISIYPYADFDHTIQHYLFLLLPHISQFGDSKNAIKGKTLNNTSISNLLIPLPPLAEQKRIVTKIEELLPYIDQYEQAWSRLEDFNKRFPEDMQKSILQMAIQGKLVEQRPEEGTGEELYRQIREEKQKLIKEGKIKKEKPMPEITEDEISYEIPSNWTWVRFGELGSYKKGPFGSTLTKSMFVSKGNNAVKVYEQKNAIQKDATLGDYYITREYFESKMKGFEIFPRDIIVSCAGTIGETYVMPDEFEQGIINQALMRMKLFEPIYVPYFLVFFDFVLKRYARSSSKGSAIKNIPPFEVLKNYLVPLPPLAEQKRIVAKLDELLPLCERLM